MAFGLKCFLRISLWLILPQPQLLQVPLHLGLHLRQFRFEGADALLHGLEVHFFLFLEGIHIAGDVVEVEVVVLVSSKVAIGMPVLPLR